MTEIDSREIRFLSQVQYLQRSNNGPRNFIPPNQLVFEDCAHSKITPETTFEYLIFKLVLKGEEHFLYLKIPKSVSQYQDIYDAGKENGTDFSCEYLYKVILFKLILNSEYSNLLLPADVNS